MSMKKEVEELRDCCHQLFRRVTVLESLIIQQFGAEVLIAADLNVPLVDKSQTVPSFVARPAYKANSGTPRQPLRSKSAGVPGPPSPLSTPAASKSRKRSINGGNQSNRESDEDDEYRLSDGDGFSKRPKQSITVCHCPNCENATRKGGSAPDKHACHITGCGQAYGDPNDLRAHIRTHKGVRRPYVCDWPSCKDTFIFSSMLERHSLAQHKEGKQYKCGICHQKFKSIHFMTKHVDEHLSRTQAHNGDDEGGDEEGDDDDHDGVRVTIRTTVTGSDSDSEVEVIELD